MTTLRELKPSKLSFIYPYAVYTEYKGKRYLFTIEGDGWTAERVASEYQSKYNNASWFVTGIWDSTYISGKQTNFKQAYNAI